MSKCSENIVSASSCWLYAVNIHARTDGSGKNERCSDMFVDTDAVEDQEEGDVIHIRSQRSLPISTSQFKSCVLV